MENAAQFHSGERSTRVFAMTLCSILSPISVDQELCPFISDGLIANFRAIVERTHTLPYTTPIPLLEIFCSHLDSVNIPNQVHAVSERISGSRTDPE